MKNLFDFSIQKKYINIQSKFDYIKYEKNETIIDDYEINFSNPINRSIKISIESESSEFFDINYYQEINVNLLKDLENLKTDRINVLFNKLNNFNNDFNCMFIDKNENILFNKLEELNIQKNQFGNALQLNKDSIKLKINKKYFNKFGNFIINDDIKNNFIFEEYDKIFKDENIFDDIKKDSVFNDFEFKKHKSKLSYDFSVKRNIHIGFLVEKYIVDENQNYIKLGSKFLFNENIINRKNDIYNKTLNDINVRYGKKYFYLIYNVYNVTLPQKENYNIFNDYIICDYPISTDIIDCVENIRPNSVNGLFLNYIDSEDVVELNWTRAFTNQNDIKAYMIFRRNSINDAYQLIHYGRFFDENNIRPQVTISDSLVKDYFYNFNTYKDKLYEKNKINIYAICSVDAHGMISNYSEQVAILINKFMGKKEVDLISRIGAPIDMPNLFINRKTKFIENDDKIETITPVVKNKKNFTLYCTPDYNNITFNNGNNESTLKEKYIFSIFKTENNSLFKDIITIKNFNSNT